MTDFDIDKAAGDLAKTQAMPPEIVLGVGRVAINYAHIELATEILFASLIAPQQHIGRALFSLLGGFELKVKAIEVLYLARHGENDPHWPELNSAFAEARSVANDRHRVVHGAYAIAENGTVGRLRTLRASKHYRVSSEDNVTGGELAEIADRAVKVFLNILAVYENLTISGKAYKFPEG